MIVPVKVSGIHSSNITRMLTIHTSSHVSIIKKFIILRTEQTFRRKYGEKQFQNIQYKSPKSYMEKFRSFNGSYDFSVSGNNKLLLVIVTISYY